MQDRFSNTTEKTFKAILKSGQSDQIWSFWSELLKKRAESFGMTEYLHLLSQLEEQNEPMLGQLRLACHLAEQPEQSKNWFEQVAQLFADVNVDRTTSDYDEQLRGELGWLCGLLFPELHGAKSVLEQGRSILIDGLDRLLDGAGLPSAENIPLLRPLLACWTRCLLLADSANTRLWKVHSHRQFEWAVLQTLRLTRKDGSAVFGPEFSEKKDSLKFRCQMEQALAFDSDPFDQLVAQTVLPGRKMRDCSGIPSEKIPQPTYHSDWSCFALFRSAWSHDAPALAVSYPGQHCQIELNFKSQPVLCGDWQVDLSLNNRRLVPLDDWVATCEVLEPTHDYLELELAFSEGFRLQRHILLLHQDDILVLADSVVHDSNLGDSNKSMVAVQSGSCSTIKEPNCSKGTNRRNRSTANTYTNSNANTNASTNTNSNAKTNVVESTVNQEVRNLANLSKGLVYRSQIPLARPVFGAVSDPDGTERVLCSRKTAKESILTRIFPLGLPEWTSQRVENEGFQVGQEVFSGEGEGARSGQKVLSLQQVNSGTTLFAPLLFDLSGSRIRQAYTWRRLTVGEKLQVVSPQQAVGFRIQLCKDQFLLYRSLTEQPSNRTVLGHNLVSDLLFGRFLKEGGVETILDVELDAER
ncbi:MAG: hypothetical protein ACRC10_06135 [Thermoguttaceae bacterium]